MCSFSFDLEAMLHDIGTMENEKHVIKQHKESFKILQQKRHIADFWIFLEQQIDIKVQFTNLHVSYGMDHGKIVLCAHKFKLCDRLRILYINPAFMCFSE